MGMAASQARLLTITARLADNELRSQTINNAKMRLATESAQASDDYITALNNAQLMFKNMDLTGTSQSQVLTFNSLTAYSPYNTQYGLTNSAGLALVSETDARNFENSGDNLENFLKSYGIEWGTSYFDEDKKLVSNLQSYYSDEAFKLSEKPEGYDNRVNGTQSNEDINWKNDPGLSFLFDDWKNKSADELKEIYETYLSKDVSIERASYNEAKTQYYNERKTLYSYAVDAIWQNLGTNILSDAVSNVIKKWNGITNPTAGTAILNTLQNEFNIKFYTGYGSAVPNKDSFAAWAKNFSIFSNDTGGGISTIFNPEDITNGNEKIGQDDYTKYEVGTLVLYVNKDKQVKYIQSLYGQGEETASEIEYKYNDGTETEKTLSLNYNSGRQELENAVLWPDILNSLIADGSKLSDDEEKFKYSYIVENSNNNIAREYSYICTEENINYQVEAAQNDLVSLILSDLTSNPESIDLDQYITVSNNSSYKNFRDEFYKLIFEDYGNDTNFDDFKKKYSELFENIDTTSSILDFTTFIQYVHQYHTENGGLPKYSSAFQNIIDAFTVELMLDELGEPSYAWIDKNDTSAEGNPDAKAQWYENLFNRMRDGYAILEDGLASSSEWIEHALESGIIFMEQVDKSYNWIALDYKCCASITEDTDNTTAVAIAEAKYNRAMNDIKRKDNMFDMQLKNIDTEHNALQTEYDVIKGVISKNIERTMKFDQSA